MAHIPRLRWIGIALESSPGVPITPARYLPFTTATLREHQNPLEDTAAYGVRDQQSENSVAGPKMGSGQIGMLLDPSLAPYLIGLALGTFGSPSSLGSGVYEHSLTRNNSNTPKTASLTFDRVTDRQLFTSSVVNSLELKFVAGEGGLATVQAEFMSKFPQTTVSGTLTTSSGTLFSFKDVSVQIGATASEAANNVATKVREFTLKITNNAEVIHQSGNNDVDSIIVKDFKVEGSVKLLFENTTQRDLYRNLTKRALICSFLGNGIGGGYSELIKFTLYKLRIQDYNIDSDLDVVSHEDLQFIGEYSSSDSKTIDALIRNRISSY